MNEAPYFFQSHIYCILAERLITPLPQLFAFYFLSVDFSLACKYSWAPKRKGGEAHTPVILKSHIPSQYLFAWFLAVRLALQSVHTHYSKCHDPSSFPSSTRTCLALPHLPHCCRQVSPFSFDTLPGEGSKGCLCSFPVEMALPSSPTD